jgi:hypothetical protein
MADFADEIASIAVVAAEVFRTSEGRNRAEP